MHGWYVALCILYTGKFDKFEESWPNCLTKIYSILKFPNINISISISIIGYRIEGYISMRKPDLKLIS